MKGKNLGCERGKNAHEANALGTAGMTAAGFIGGLAFNAVLALMVGACLAVVCFAMGGCASAPTHSEIMKSDETEPVSVEVRLTADKGWELFEDGYSFYVEREGAVVAQGHVQSIEGHSYLNDVRNALGKGVNTQFAGKEAVHFEETAAADPECWVIHIGRDTSGNERYVAVFNRGVDESTMKQVSEKLSFR